MAFAGLNATARDFARIGELYRNDGVWNGRQVVPRAWVRDSVTVRAAHLAPGEPVVGGYSAGREAPQTGSNGQGVDLRALTESPCGDKLPPWPRCRARSR